MASTLTNVRNSDRVNQNDVNDDDDAVQVQQITTNGSSNVDQKEKVIENDDCYYIDPSQAFRPEGKSNEEYRIYSTNKNDKIQQRVYEHYLAQHRNQTLTFARERLHYWTRFNHTSMTIMDALERLSQWIDQSDPDIDLPNIVHAFQTAEMIRKVHPDLPWFQLTGLIHDLGKLIAVFGEPQWATAGDTYPLGCALGRSVVYLAEGTFNDNVDWKNEPLYRTKCGIYEPNCGLDQLTMTWGHDEYLYQVLKNSAQCSLPEQALYIIRFHSFYPWHTGGDYYHLCSSYDHAMLPWVREFNKFDLYSKCPDVPDVNELKPYYQSLIEEYIPGKIAF